MTSLTIFATEITSLESQLTNLQQQLDELRQAENAASQIIEALTDALPKFEKMGAIAKIKDAVLALFSQPEPITEPAPTNPTSEEIFDAEVQPAAPAPAVEPAPTTEPAPSVEETAGEQMNQQYIEQIFLTRTVAFQKRHDGEIVCAYIGLNTQKLAQNWADCLELWGCDAEVRKAKRMSAADIRWEVKIKKISKAQLEQLAANHDNPFQSVPAAPGSRVTEEKKPENQQNPSAQPGGKPSDAEPPSEPKQPVSLVLGKADNVYLSYFVNDGRRNLGRVERLSATSEWSVPGIPGTWPTPEAAADALIAKREKDRSLHQKTNDELRARYGLPV